MNQYAANQNAKEIQAVELERKEVERKNAELQAKVVDLTLQQSAVKDEQKEWKAKDLDNQALIAGLQNQVKELEGKRDDIVRNLRGLDTVSEIETRFGEIYPVVTRDKHFGLMDIESDGITYPYMLIPAGFTVTFMDEHEELLNADAQLATYVELTDKYGTALDIKNKILALEERNSFLESQKSLAYRDGYNECNVRYDGIVERYIELANKPRFQMPSGWTIAATALAAGIGGGYVGNQIGCH